MYILEKSQAISFDEHLQTYPMRHKFPMVYILEPDENPNDWMFTLDLYIHNGVEAVETGVHPRSNMRHPKLDYDGFWLRNAKRKKANLSSKRLSNYCAVYRCCVSLDHHVVSQEVFTELRKRITNDIDKIKLICKKMVNQDWPMNVMEDAQYEEGENKPFLALETMLTTVSREISNVRFSFNDLSPVDAIEFCDSRIGFRYWDNHLLPVSSLEDVRTATFAVNNYTKAKIVEKRLKYHFADGKESRYTVFEIEANQSSFALAVQQKAISLGCYMTNMRKAYDKWLEPLYGVFHHLDSDADLYYRKLQIQNQEIIQNMRKEGQDVDDDLEDPFVGVLVDHDPDE